MRKTRIGDHFKDQVTLIPEWKRDTAVEIISAGLRGKVGNPQGHALDRYYVTLDPREGDSPYRPRIVVAHATDLRAVE